MFVIENLPPVYQRSALRRVANIVDMVSRLLNYFQETLLINDSGSRRLWASCEYLCEFDAKIAKALTVVKCRNESYEKSENQSHCHVPLRVVMVV